MTIAEATARRATSRKRLEVNGWRFIETRRDDCLWSCVAKRPGLMCEQTSEHSAEHALDKALRYASMVSNLESNGRTKENR